MNITDSRNVIYKTRSLYIVVNVAVVIGVSGPVHVFGRAKVLQQGFGTAVVAQEVSHHMRN